MLRSILSVCIMGFTGLLIMAILLPTHTKILLEGAISTSHEFSSLLPFLDTTPKTEREIESDITNKTPFQPIQNATKTIIDAIAPKNKEVIQNSNELTIGNIIDATNKERIKEGLAPLSVNQKLSVSAKMKTEDMIKNNYFEHVSPTGITVSDLGNTVGYDYVIMGENLALGNFTGSDDLLAAWMNSPGHRANILNINYTEIGIYAAQGKYQGRTVWFAVQHFGTTRTACPTINQTLKNDIDTTNNSLKKKETQILALRKQIDATEDKSTESYSNIVNTFNTLVAEYNQQLATSKLSITRYNNQVAAFNICLAKYQKTVE